MRVVACAIAVVAAAVLAATGPSAAPDAGTHVYLSNGRYVGSVQANSPSPSCEPDPGLEAPYVRGPDRRGGYVMISHFGGTFAWPRHGTKRRVYYIRQSRPWFVMRWVSRNRWDFFAAGERVAYAKGPEGPAAGLAFYSCYPGSWK